MVEHSEPRFSVVIPTWNRAEALQRALHDVLGQELAEFEVIVVVDGSTDSTVSELSDVVDRRLRVVRREHGGPCVARNAGAAVAKGEWLVFLDDDDRVASDWLRILDEHTHNPEVAVVCCGATLIDEHESVIGTSRARPLGPLYGGINALFAPATFAVRRSLFETVGGYDPMMTFGENFELGMRIGHVCQGDGLRIAVDDRCPIRWLRRPATPLSTAGVHARYGAAARLLEKHPARLRVDRQAFWDTLSIAGINAARLGDRSRARRHLWRAVLVRPSKSRSWLRLATALSPRLTRRVWGEFR